MTNSTSNSDLQADMGKRIFLEYDREQLIRKFQLKADKRQVECRSFRAVMTVYKLLCYNKNISPVGMTICMGKG